MKKIEPHLREEALRVVRETGVAVGPGLVARRLSVSWATARTLLLELAVAGKVRAEKTSKSWLFKPLEV